MSFNHSLFWRTSRRLDGSVKELDLWHKIPNLNVFFVTIVVLAIHLETWVLIVLVNTKHLVAGLHKSLWLDVVIRSLKQVLMQVPKWGLCISWFLGLGSWVVLSLEVLDHILGYALLFLAQTLGIG